MKKTTLITAATLTAAAGMAMAQPTVDGVYDPGTEASFYGDILWTNPNPTSFGDNAPGLFDGGSSGDPENVTTGVEIAIPKSVLSNATSFRIAGWINAGNRDFLSNQIIHDGGLPLDTGNIGREIDWATDPRFPTNEFATVDNIPSGTPSVDGTLDAGVYTTRYFLQTNFTGFGDNGDATDQGGGGSEIDALYVAQDASNYYIFVAGNVEANGNGLDMFIDVDGGATGVNELIGSGQGSGDFIIDGLLADNGNGGFHRFDTGFAANVLLSIDSVDNGGVREPRAFLAADLASSNLTDLLGTLAGYGFANAGALAGGDAGVPAVSLAVDNSNIIGVTGSSAARSPESPDDNWAYGSEMNNLRGQVIPTEDGGMLHLFIGANLARGFEKMVFLFDVQDGGQNPMRTDNADISFGGLNTHGGLILDDGFEADYWFNINTGNAGGTTLINFMDASPLRTDGPLFDLFTGFLLDYGAFFGGDLEGFDGTPAANPVELIDFSGPRIDIQDGTLSGLFTEFAPRTAQLDPNNPVPGLLQGAIDNSNVAGVTDTTADAAAANAVNTGVELMLDLDELGWDGTSEVRVMAWIANSGFDFVSNQGLGFPAGSGQLSDPDGIPDSGDEAAIGEIDFSMIPGDQFIVIPVAGGDPGCNPADLAEPFGQLTFGDISAFLAAFNTMDPAADLAVPFGQFTFGDISAFLAAFDAGCP
jgi:hypothetical protein